MRTYQFSPDYNLTGKFKPGDVIRIVDGDSKTWVKSVPLVVQGYMFPNSPHVLDLHGDDPTTSDQWINHVQDEDCVLDVFLTEARKANQ